jgi:hypothetical protein
VLVAVPKRCLRSRVLDTRKGLGARVTSKGLKSIGGALRAVGGGCGTQRRRKVRVPRKQPDAKGGKVILGTAEGTKVRPLFIFRSPSARAGQESWRGNWA